MLNKLNAKGLICPEPIMLLHKAIREAKHGDKIEVLATDPSTERDIEKFCNFLGCAGYFDIYFSLSRCTCS